MKASQKVREVKKSKTRVDSGKKKKKRVLKEERKKKELQNKIQLEVVEKAGGNYYTFIGSEVHLGEILGFSLSYPFPSQPYLDY